MCSCLPALVSLPDHQLWCLIFPFLLPSSDVILTFLSFTFTPPVWYLHHRQYTLQHAEEEDAFDGEKREDPLKLKELPVGKWSRKESREDWVRSLY